MRLIHVALCAMVCAGLMAQGCTEAGLAGAPDTPEDVGPTPMDDAAQQPSDVPPPPSSDIGEDAATPDVAEADVPAPDPPEALAPCAQGDCWEGSRGFGGACGLTSFGEDFSSGRYNVHAFELQVRADLDIDLEFIKTDPSEGWAPAIVVHDDFGQTIYDGQTGALGEGFFVEAVETGRELGRASARLRADDDTTLTVFLTSWQVIDSGFVDRIPTEATYRLDVSVDCDHVEGEVICPPNYDPDDTVGGYHLLPPSQPEGLYTRKADDCSRGTERLVCVLYTVAVEWNRLHPERPLTFLDLNESPPNSCSSVDHATHSDGTHVDITAGCATTASCDDPVPAIELARLFIDTGVACGIIFDDAEVAEEVNAYFEARYSYRPWWGTFMRHQVGGHAGHFHLRVMKPDGDCRE